MRKIWIGQQILQLRQQQNISLRELSKGLCSVQTLFEIEGGFSLPDKLLVDILIQRLGKSPDKLEMILSYETYKQERIRDLYEELLEKGRAKKAEALLEGYSAKFRKDNKVQRMYYCRSRAYAAYRLEHDLGKAEAWIEEALDITLKGWKERVLWRYRISTIEMENLLFYARMLWEKSQKEGRKQAQELLEACRNYIDRKITDGEEHVKVFGKCAWLLARAYVAEGRHKEALGLCEQAFSEMREYAISYFMLPLLDVMEECGRALGRREEWELYRNYRTALENLYQEYYAGEHFLDSIFHNCCQKEYYLDYEIIRGERQAQQYTQERFVEGIYEAPENLSRMENGKEAPHAGTLRKMMDKLQMEKERYNSFAITEVFEDLELKQEIDIATTRRECERAEQALLVLKDKLDMQVRENKQLVQYYETSIRFQQKKISGDEVQKKAMELLEETYRISENGFYRPPFHIEAKLINLIGLTLKKSEKADFCRGALRAMEQSGINIRYRYRSYGLLLCNLATELRSAQHAQKNLKYTLACGKLNTLYYDHMTIINSLLVAAENRDLCRRMMRDNYYLCELSMCEKNKRIVLEYYQKQFGEPLLQA